MSIMSLKHIGKQPLKFSFECYLCDLRGLPSDVSQVAVSWERAGKQLAVSKAAATQTTGSEERTAMMDETLRVGATLYRSSRRAVFDAKPTLIRVLDVSGGPYAASVVLGSADFDLAEHAELNANAPARSIQLRLPRAAFRRGDAKPDMTILIQMTIASRWLQSASGTDGLSAGDTTPRDSSSEPTLSDASGSLPSSSALTHEALQALDASHPPRAAAVAAAIDSGVTQRRYARYRSLAACTARARLPSLMCCRCVAALPPRHGTFVVVSRARTHSYL